MKPLELMRLGCDLGGHTWYLDAVPYVHAFGWATGVGPELAAGLLAVYSPRVQVRRSVELAHIAALTGHPVQSAIPSARAAHVHLLKTGEIRGPKTGAFARALLGDPDAVVVDTWVMKALGRKRGLPVEDYGPCMNVTPKTYPHFAAIVKRLATRLGLSPAAGQAALWCGIYHETTGRPAPDMTHEIGRMIP